MQRRRFFETPQALERRGGAIEPPPSDPTQAVLPRYNKQTYQEEAAGRPLTLSSKFKYPPISVNTTPHKVNRCRTGFPPVPVLHRFAKPVLRRWGSFTGPRPVFSSPVLHRFSCTLFRRILAPRLKTGAQVRTGFTPVFSQRPNRFRTGYFVLQLRRAFVQTRRRTGNLL